MFMHILNISGFEMLKTLFAGGNDQMIHSILQNAWSKCFKE